jgi:hypothetical protein
MRQCIAITVLIFSLIFAGALARSDEWEQVPPDYGQVAPGKNNMDGAPLSAKAGMACTMVGAFAQEAAKLRDKGVSEKSQLASIDKPGGKLYQLTVAARLSAAAGSAVRAGIHREIAYVYEHREMTPAQLAAQARQVCGASDNSADDSPPSAPP